MRKRALTIVAMLVASVAHGDVDRDAAKRAFDAFQRHCTRDNGKLWGVSLCGPIVIVDRTTRDAVSSDGWSGKLPDNIGIANTAFDWNGKRASMVMWPLPADEGARDRLLLHERFHAIQDRIGLPMSPPGANEHLDTLDGRYLMRLQMRALEAALAAKSKSAERRAYEDALAFRAERFAKFPNAAAEEAALDRNEGWAEYTGVRLFTTDRERMKQVATEGLKGGETSDAFGRSYAYATGPAWGLLLDQLNPGWQKTASVWPPASAGGAKPLAATYDGRALLKDETARDEQRKARLASYEKRFVEGRVLVAPLAHFNMQLDPYDVHPFPGHGTVYEHLTVSDEWGKVVTEVGALISDDFKTLTLFTAPAGSTDGPPWTITLAQGWRLGSGKRPGDLEVQRIAQ